MGVVVACAVLQAIAVGLARWAYLGFGWRMYSKIAGDMRLPDIDRRRMVGLRLDRFSALAKLDAQLLCLMLVVGLVNGINPSGAEVLKPLTIVAAVGVTAAAAWLAACWTAVAAARPHLGLAAEFTYPLCYIVAAAYMFSSVYYGSRLSQIHGQVYLIVYPILFVAWRTCVWWDARLLSGSDLFSRSYRDLKAKRPHGNDLGLDFAAPPPGHLPPHAHVTMKDTMGEAAAGGHHGPQLQLPPHVPPEILPLVHGAWLLKLPSASGAGASPTKRALGLEGRWRYFQLSHDGSTLRWDWRKYVLLLHVESVSACTQDLTITLSLTLEPDLRLKFPDAELHSVWARGLTLLVMLLGNPDGLEGTQASRLLSVGSRDHSQQTQGVPDPGSPNRLLHRLASASARYSAAGLLSKDTLQAAAYQARKALGDHSEPQSPFTYGFTDLEKGPGSEDGSAIGHKVIAVHATSVQRHGSGNLRQRTPSQAGGGNGYVGYDEGAGGVDSDGGQKNFVPGRLPGAPTPSPSRSKRRRKEAGQSWLRRTLTAPVSSFAANLQQTMPVSRHLAFDGQPPATTGTTDAVVSPRFDLEAQQAQHAGMASPPLPAAAPVMAMGVPHRPRHLRSSSLGSESMPPVPEGSGSYTPAPPLPPTTQTTPGSGGARPGGGANTAGVYHLVAVAGGRYPRGKSSSPASGGKERTSPTRTQRGSPLKPTASGAAGQGALVPLGGPTLARYSSAPMYVLQHAMSGMETADSDAAAQLQHMASDASWQAQSGGTAGALARYDSLGQQWAPGSKVWQAMFDAGMLASFGHGKTGGSTEGSPSPTATPLSVRSATRSVAVNVELIDFQQLSFGRMLGQGAEGPVYAAWFQETPVAVKRASCMSEVDLHLHAGWHDNVVNLRGLAQHGGHTYLVMELCPRQVPHSSGPKEFCHVLKLPATLCPRPPITLKIVCGKFMMVSDANLPLFALHQCRGTLDMLIHQRSASSALDPTKLLPIVRSIARGMLHLHTRTPAVMHRDLKPANVFIGHGFVMKIGDFGMARYAADTRAARAAQAHMSPSKFGSGNGLLRTLTPGVIGTAAYCAPELLQSQTPKAGEAFDPDALLQADVYSFGVLLWELLERKRPYSEMDGFQIQTQWVLDPDAMKLKPPKVPEGLPPGSKRVMATLSKLVEQCTAWDPDARPTFKDILATLRSASIEGETTKAPQGPQLVSPFS